MGIIPKSGNKANCAHYAERPCKELVLPFVRKNNVGHFLYSFNYPFHFLILQSKQIIGGTTAHFTNYYYPFRDNPFGLSPLQRFVIFTCCALSLAPSNKRAAISFFNTFFPFASERAIASFTLNLNAITLIFIVNNSVRYSLCIRNAYTLFPPKLGYIPGA